MVFCLLYACFFTSFSYMFVVYCVFSIVMFFKFPFHLFCFLFSAFLTVFFFYFLFIFFFFKQKTAYEMRISDWISDVCSSDLEVVQPGTGQGFAVCSIHGVRKSRMMIRRCGRARKRLNARKGPSWPLAVRLSVCRRGRTCGLPGPRSWRWGG